jgi:ubiquinone/menaquinone biosynthesis C-methylase UbiE
MPGPVLHSPLMDRHFLSHYGTGVERARLQGGGSRIEFARTKELLERYLPPAPARVLDVGGGPGAYAAWLSERGYAVHLIDPVPLHVEQAASLAAECESGFTAALGDARRLEEPDASYDAVLLLGPLYHLVNRDERVRALAEARRVARSGGIVAAAAISRFASLLDGLRSGYSDRPSSTRSSTETCAKASIAIRARRRSSSLPRTFTARTSSRRRGGTPTWRSPGCSESRVRAGCCGSCGRTPGAGRTSCESHAL